jgi:hypothetical protein
MKNASNAHALMAETINTKKTTQMTHLNTNLTINQMNTMSYKLLDGLEDI